MTKSIIDELLEKAIQFQEVHSSNHYNHEVILSDSDVCEKALQSKEYLTYLRHARP